MPFYYLNFSKKQICNNFIMLFISQIDVVKTDYLNLLILLNRIK